MLKLSGSDRKQLHEAIQAAYPDPDDLKLFVDEELGKNLAVITGGGKLRTVVADLIREAVDEAFGDRLILALAKDTDNPYIQGFCARVLPQYLQMKGDSVAVFLRIMMSLQGRSCVLTPRKIGVPMLDKAWCSF